MWSKPTGPCTPLDSDPSTRPPVPCRAVPERIEAQTGQVLDNLETALGLRGRTLADVVKTTVHLQHLDRDFAAYNTVYARRFGPPYPARTTVGSQLASILVEIDAVAIRTD